MQVKVYNPSNLKQNQIEKIVTRVKIIIMNSDNEILVCHTNNNYSFIGGHVEKNESLFKALKRELKEETGLDIETLDIQPFFKIEKMNRNHYGTNINCCSEIYYYVIYTDSKYIDKQMNLDDSEKANNFHLEYVDIDEFINYLQQYDGNDLYVEMLDVLNYFKQSLNRGKTYEKRI